MKDQEVSQEEVAPGQQVERGGERETQAKGTAYAETLQQREGALCQQNST